MSKYEDFISRKEHEYGDKFNPSGLDPGSFGTSTPASVSGFRSSVRTQPARWESQPGGCRRSS